MKIWTGLISEVAILSLIFALPCYAEKNIIIEAHQINWHYTASLLVAEGKVIISYDGMVLEAEKVEVNLDTAQIQGWGKIQLGLNSHKIKGDVLSFNLLEEKGVIEEPRGKEGPIIFEAQEAFLSPERIDLEKSSFTTCQLTHPHYHIKARVVQIYPGEKLVVRSATFYLGSFPIFWTPLLVQYIEGKGHFLTPRPGYSKFSGWNIKSGYYFYFSPQMEGSFRLDWRERKGWAGGLDFLHHTAWSRTDVSTYYLKEKDTNNERGMMRVRNITSLSSSSMLKLAVDYFSDEEILKNYLYFLSSEEKRVSPSFLSISVMGERYAGSIIWQPEVCSFTDFPEFLPRIKMSFFHPSIAFPGFYLEEETELTNFVRDDKVTLRAYSSLDLSYPFSLLRFLRMRPSLYWDFFYYQPQGGASSYEISAQQSCEFFFQLLGREGNFSHSLNSTLGYYHTYGLGKEFPYHFDEREEEALARDIFKLNLQNDFFWKNSSLFSLDFTVDYDLLLKKFKPLNASLLAPLSQGKFYTDFCYNFYERSLSYLRSGLKIQKKRWSLESIYKNYAEWRKKWLSFEASFDLFQNFSILTEIDYDLEEKKMERLKYGVNVKFHCLGLNIEIQDKPEIEYNLGLYIVAFPSF